MGWRDEGVVDFGVSLCSSSGNAQSPGLVGGKRRESNTQDETMVKSAVDWVSCVKFIWAPSLMLLTDQCQAFTAAGRMNSECMGWPEVLTHIHYYPAAKLKF